ncbi:MAG: carbon-nitrogen family hydrolase, partial [Firmicutes bacterium]|nr:carbon-nitrogen family hydrolase [Bacillota bacterium]
MDVCFISLANDDKKTKSRRIAYVKNLMRENAGHDIYLLPEMWNTGFFSVNMYEENAEGADGETFTAMSEAAAELGAYVFGGSIIE